MRSQPPVSRQFAKFAIVGIANTLIGVAVYSATRSPALAFTAGAVNGYVFNARWTFGCCGSKLRYLIVQLGGLGATSFISATASYWVALPLVTLATFAANRAWTFAPAPAG
jgi:putative flippase GtrA